MPDHYIVDTSIFVRWFLRQTGWQGARAYRDRFLAQSITLETTECARFELPHVLRTKGVLPGKLTHDDYRAAVRVIDDLGIPVKPLTADGLEECAVLAVTSNLRFFDAVFLHRAIVTGGALLTADHALATVAASLQVEVAFAS